MSISAVFLFLEVCPHFCPRAPPKRQIISRKSGGQISNKKFPRFNESFQEIPTCCWVYVDPLLLIKLQCRLFFPSDQTSGRRVDSIARSSCTLHGRADTVAPSPTRPNITLHKDFDFPRRYVLFFVFFWNPYLQKCGKVERSKVQQVNRLSLFTLLFTLLFCAEEEEKAVGHFFIAATEIFTSSFAYGICLLYYNCSKLFCECRLHCSSPKKA